MLCDRLPGPTYAVIESQRGSSLSGTPTILTAGNRWSKAASLPTCSTIAPIAITASLHNEGSGGCRRKNPMTHPATRRHRKKAFYCMAYGRKTKGGLGRLQFHAVMLTSRERKTK
jgi:hypothetical protein